MGVTQEGNLLDWKETKKYSEYVRQEAINQFINLYRKVKDRKAEAFVWGDEIEHILIKLDYVQNTAYVLPKNTHNLLLHLNGIGSTETSDKYGSIWMPEYGAFQLESIPGRPFGSSFSTFNMVESNMNLRRKQVASVLDRKNGEVCLTMTHLPRFGCQDSYYLPNDLEEDCYKITKSSYYPDVIVSPFSRFRGIEINTRERRGEHISINIPVFKDIQTMSPFWDPYSRYQRDEGAKASKVDHIHGDCTAAASYSCLQVTFQTSDVLQAKYLYDQLIPMCPIMLALSASTPVYRGFLSDVDCRWNAMSASLDSRNREERGLEPLTESKFVIPKAAYDTPSLYLSEENEVLNDIEAPFEESTFKKLVNGGVDIHLARYISYILIRDPIILYEENIHQNSEEDTGHFDNIFSMNWLSVRLKPPIANDRKMGWRVEFRPLEVQLTDFENAAYAIFIMLLVRSIDKFKLDLAAPISKVDSNMKHAQARDAVGNQTFYFKEDIESRSGGKKFYPQISIDVIVNGGVTSSGADFPGLIPLIKRYISTVEDADGDMCATVSRYLQLISDRAAGRVNTTARWIRNFVENHPDYKYDSVISERINYDLVKLFRDISDGTVVPRHLHPVRQCNGDDCGDY